MFNRFLKAVGYLVGGFLFPIVCMYQVVEILVVMPFYWIITGKDYSDTYDLITSIWLDLMSGDRALKGLSFKNRFKFDY